MNTEQALRTICLWAFNQGKNDLPEYQFKEELEFEILKWRVKK